MKKLKSVAMALLCLVTACGGALAGCKKGGDDPLNEKVDETRTQLYVFNFAGGYGVDWLLSVKESFEAKHAASSFEDGKTGVQIMIRNEKVAMDSLASQVLDNKEEVYFTEYAYYYSLKNQGVLGDITPAVTGDLSAYGDASGSTIEGKLSDAQKAYYNMGGAYYGIPHYSGYSGLIYNVDLFERQGYYFKNGYNPSGSLEDKFVYYATDTRTAGPDGQTGTEDDGLPATYQEFYWLCDRIKQDNNTPIIWNGKGAANYLNNLLDTLAADVEGYDQRMLNYTLDGVATTLGTIQGGQFVKDAEPTTITATLNSAVEVFRQEGKYQALKFLETVINNQYYYQDTSGGSFNTGLSHLDTQDNFLYAGNDGVTNDIAMLCDGIWWESEATDTFNAMVENNGDSFSKMNRKFGFMPMPKVDSTRLGKNTLQDNIYSMCFMKANIADFKKELAYDFIKYVNSDALLREFTTITNTPKALNYDMGDAINNVSPFGRSVLSLKQRSDIVYPFSTSSVYANHQASFWTHDMWKTKVGDYERQAPSSAIYELGISSADYFNGMKPFYLSSSGWSSFF